MILGWAVMVAVAGKDEAWDFKNYHWYIPYAFLNNRMAIDVAVAHQATYYNPPNGRPNEQDVLDHNPGEKVVLFPPWGPR